MFPGWKRELEKVRSAYPESRADTMQILLA